MNPEVSTSPIGAAQTAGAPGAPTPEASTLPAYEYTTFPRKFLSYRWFKPILVALLTFVFMVIFQIGLIVIAVAWEGNIDFLMELGTSYDNLNPYFTSGALIEIGGVAAMFPALALAALIVRDRPFSSYSSSRGGWNWPAFAKCLGVAVVVICLPSIIQLVLFPDPNATGVIRFTVGGIIACTILVPFQCLAEEYIFRGLILQAVGSWTKLPVLAIIVSAAVFAAGHPYNVIGILAIFLNGIVWGIIVQQTKGLEASGAAHIVNNYFAFCAGGLGVSPVTSEIDIPSFAISFVIDLVYLTVILIAAKKFNWFTSKGDGAAAFNEKHRAKLARKQQAKQSMQAQMPAQNISQIQNQPQAHWQEQWQTQAAQAQLQAQTQTQWQAQAQDQHMSQKRKERGDPPVPPTRYIGKRPGNDSYRHPGRSE